MTGAVTALDAARATNLWGKLGPDLRRRLEAVINDPTPETWDDAHSLILNGDTWVTLWQAVLVADPSFPRSKPTDEPWAAVPTRQTLITALRLAVRD